MFKVTLIAIIVTLFTNVATHYFGRNQMEEDLTALERRTVARARTLSEELTTADEDMGKLIRGSNNLISSYSGRLNVIKEGLSSINTNVGTELATLKAQQSEYSRAFHDVKDQATNFEIRLNSLEGGILLISNPLEKLRADLQDVQSSLIASSQTISTIESTVDAEKVIPALLSYSKPCPSTAVNRDERLPRFRRELEQSRSTGIHNVTVKFDINKNGAVILQGLESSTAPANIIGAVKRYVDGLMFDGEGREFADCEAVVKLEVS